MLDLAASTLMFLSYVVLLQVARNSTMMTAGAYSIQDTCPASALEQVWSNRPPCRPRKVLVKLPLPDDPDVIEVIPAQVEVSLCGGVCHEGNLYHKCVPKTGARTKKTVQAVFRNVNAEIGNPGMTCANIEVEEHTDCKCGCDVEVASCNSQQDYDHFFCKCRCRNTDDRRLCQQNRRQKMWDEKQCRCLCRPEEYRECSTGFVYDPVDTCRCVRMSRGFQREGVELTTNLAGVEIVTPLCLLLLLFIISTLVLAWKLRQAMSKSKNIPEPEIPFQARSVEESESLTGEDDSVPPINRDFS